MATATDTPTAARSVARVDSLVWLTLMIAASIALRLVVNTRFQAPTILTDELTYSNLARQISDGQFSLANGYGVVYPLLMAPSWAIAQFGTDAYTYMKATNAVLVSLTAIPVFLWARRMMRHGYALLAAGLTLLMPSMAYSGHVMTENAFVLFFMIAVWRIAVAVERPTLLNQALLLVALAVAFATRAQAIVLLPALPAVAVLAAIAEERAGEAFAWRGVGRRLARFWPLAALAFAGLLAAAARTLLSDWRWNQLLQAYSTTADGQYTASNVARYFLWHLGEATFALGVIPVAALLVLIGMGILNRTRSAAERAYLCTALVAIPLVVLQVATFTSYWSQRVSERNMFCVFPIVLIGLALWMDRGLPRTRRTAALAAAIAGVLVMSVPYGRLYQLAPSTETWALVLPDILARKVTMGGDDIQPLIALGAAIALLIYGVARLKVALVAVPLVVIAYFAFSQYAAVHTVAKAARDYRNAPGVAGDAAWIDRQVGRDDTVGFITGSNVGPDAERIGVWEAQFFNRAQVEPVQAGTAYTVDATTGAVSAPPDGLPSFVVTPTSATFVGRTLGAQNGYLLQQVAPPYRMALTTGGMYADGWSDPTVAANIYESNADSAVTISADRMGAPPGVSDTTATVRIGELSAGPDGATTISGEVQTQLLPVLTTAASSVSFSVPKTPYRIEIVFASTFRFDNFGVPDGRDLGGRASLSTGEFRAP